MISCKTERVSEKLREKSDVSNKKVTGSEEEPGDFFVLSIVKTDIRNPLRYLPDSVKFDSEIVQYDAVFPLYFAAAFTCVNRPDF